VGRDVVQLGLLPRGLLHGSRQGLDVRCLLAFSISVLGLMSWSSRLELDWARQRGFESPWWLRIVPWVDHNPDPGSCKIAVFQLRDLRLAGLVWVN